MTVKSVLVRLRGDNGDLNRALLGSAAASKVLEKNLKGADNSAKDLTRGLETSNDRTTMLVQSALALGPALVPIGAQAVPILMGIATQAVVGTAAVGTMVLAFQGVGTTLKAVNDYAVEPSAASFEKMQKAMEKLGPAGADFVMYLQSLRPELQGLQDVAQEGLLPGAQDGIESLMTMLPQVERIVGSLSTELGDMFSQSGASLAGPGFEEFFSYLETEAKPLLSDMGDIVGNFVQTFANLVVAFGPLTEDFSGNFVQMSEDIRAWSKGLDETDGFQSFMSYIEETGPEVWSTLGALSQALLAIAEAAAPVGAVSLPIIKAIADTLAAIAKSPAGPILIGAAAGFSAVSRAIALYKIANGSALIGMLEKLGPVGLSSSIGTRAAGAGIGALLLSMTDADDKLGLTNTAMLGMLGTIGGPWGAAFGAAAGAFLDFKAAGDDVSDNIASWNKAIEGSSTSFEKQASIIDDAIAKRDELQRDLDNPGALSTMFSAFDPQEIANGWANLTGDSNIQKYRDEVASLTDTQNANKAAASALGTAYGVDLVGPMSYSKVSVQDLADVLARATPAMDALGYSFQDLAAMSPTELDSVTGQLADWTTYADSGKGKTDELSGAFADLDNDLYSASVSADHLKVALDALLSPQLGLSEATDAWTTALRHLNDDLAKNRTLEGNGDAAIQNRSAIRARVADMTALMVAQAKAGASSAELSRNMRRQRGALIDAGVAAGFGRDEMRGFIKEMGLTPKLVKTVIQENAPEARGHVSALRKALEDITGHPWTSHIDASTSAAMAALAQARAQLNAFDGSHYTAIMELHTVRTGAGGQGGGYSGAADGTSVPKTGLPYADRHLYLLADGEEVISNRYGQADQFRRDRAAGVIPRYAEGGEIGRSSRPVRAGGSSTMQVLIGGHMTGMMTTPSGEFPFSGQVREIARQEVRADSRFDRVRPRQ